MIVDMKLNEMKTIQLWYFTQRGNILIKESKSIDELLEYASWLIEGFKCIRGSFWIEELDYNYASRIIQ